MKLGWFLTISGCTTQNFSGLPPSVGQRIEEIRDNLINLGHEIFNREETLENAVISPLSIMGSLLMLSGATSGKAQEEINALLKINNLKDDLVDYKLLMDYLLANDDISYSLSIANGLFYQSGYTPMSTFTDLMGSFDGVNEVNFSKQSATDDINQWVSDSTNEKIPNLFEKTLDPQTLAMLISSLYYKASWSVPFELIRYDYYCWKSVTEDCDKSVQFMSVDNTFNVHFGNEFTVVDVPLTLTGGCKENMNCEDSMDDGIETFTMMKLWMPNHVLSTKSEHEKFQKLIRKNNEIMDTEMQFRRINLIMPRFSIETKQDLKNTFLDLGMNEVFNDGFHFDPLFGKDNYSPASVSQIKHAVKLDVDENGIEGAATTAIGMMFRSMPPDVPFDKPFYFSIEANCREFKNKESKYESENTEYVKCPQQKTPLFIGRVVTPIFDK